MSAHATDFDGRLAIAPSFWARWSRSSTAVSGATKISKGGVANDSVFCRIQYVTLDRVAARTPNLIASAGNFDCCARLIV